MRKAKRTITRAVVFTEDEWKKVTELAKEQNMLAAVFIRSNALNCKFMKCDNECFVKLNNIMEYNCINGNISHLNRIAKTVNAEKRIFEKDVEEAEKIVSHLEHFVNNLLPPFTFTEVSAKCLLSSTSQ